MSVIRNRRAGRGNGDILFHPTIKLLGHRDVKSTERKHYCGRSQFEFRNVSVSRNCARLY